MPPETTPSTPYVELDRDAWTRLSASTPLPLTVADVSRLRGLGDPIDLAEVDAIVKPYGLTFARYEALVLLVFSRKGALPLSKIGERLQVHPTSVTNIVDRLEKSGLVTRRPNPLDGRGILAEITDAGREAVEQATTDLMRAEFGLSALSPAQHDSLFDTFRVLRHSAGDFED